jgi:hypothetical protein
MLTKAVDIDSSFGRRRGKGNVTLHLTKELIQVLTRRIE